MAHYYSEKQPSDLRLKKINIEVLSSSFEFYTGSGVFSKSKLDKGTKLLIEKGIVEPEWDILDLGCGIGIVGIVLKKTNPMLNVMMTDVNERALKLTKMNADLHKVKADIKKSDLYKKITRKFNSIFSNPPQTAGKEVCFSIIEKAPGHLKKGGIFQLVARHNKGGKTLKKKMEEVFGNVEEIAKGSGYRVYASSKLD